MDAAGNRVVERTGYLWGLACGLEQGVGAGRCGHGVCKPVPHSRLPGVVQGRSGAHGSNGARRMAGPAGADQGQAGAVVAAGAEKRSEGRIYAVASQTAGGV